MQEKLIIYLHANNLSHPSWAVLNADGSVRQSAVQDDASGLAEIAEDKEVIVIVPGEEVLLTSVVLPKMSRSRLAQALPFALEEKVIDEIDALHFVPGVYHTDKPLSVAIVAREKMLQWLELLKSWHVQPDLLIPAALALPYAEHTWTVMLHDVAIIRTQLEQGFSCDKENVAELLQLALSEVTDAPQMIHIHNYHSESCANFLRGPCEIKEELHDNKAFIDEIGREMGKLPVINLLQGPFTSKKSKFPRRDKLWKASVCFMIAWIGLLFLGPAVSYFILKQRNDYLEAQIAQIYKRNFPQSTNMVAPKMRMEEKLRKLSSNVGENHLFLLMGYLGKDLQTTASSETANIKFKRFDYQNNQLTLELTAGSSDDFSAFTDYLTKQGLKVKQQNANLTGSRLNATLQIE